MQLVGHQVDRHTRSGWSPPPPNTHPRAPTGWSATSSKPSPRPRPANCHHRPRLNGCTARSPGASPASRAAVVPANVLPTARTVWIDNYEDDVRGTPQDRATVEALVGARVDLGRSI